MFRTVPRPSQRGQVSCAVSPRDKRKRWRDISSNPKREIRPTWMRALSDFSASFKRLSTSRWCLLWLISIKSITTRPPRSRNLSCLAISSAASRLVLKAVDSISAPLVAFAELMSIEIKASVRSMTSAPPEGSAT